MSKIIDDYFEHCAYVEMDKDDLEHLEKSIREDEKNKYPPNTTLQSMVDSLTKQLEYQKAANRAKKGTIDRLRRELDQHDKIFPRW